MGIGLLLVVGLAGCTSADPAKVASIAATVKKLDLKSLGGVACEGIYNAPPGGTVTYERTIAIRGSGQVLTLVAGLERAGFRLAVGETEASKTYVFLDDPHDIRATLLSMERASPGERFHLDDAHMCTVPKEGLTIIALAPSGV